MIVIDEKKIFEIIYERNPRSVALNGPEGLLPRIEDTANKIAERVGIPAYIIADTCWGSCDINEHAADILGVDILFNIGHTISAEQFGNKTTMINAYDDIGFEDVARKCAKELKCASYKSISLLTISQHLNQLCTVKEIFEQYGYTVIIGRGKGQLNDGQVFGCEFHTVYDRKIKVDAYVFLGQSQFHSAGIAMSTEKPVYMLDPYSQEYSEVNEIASHLKKRAILSVYKAFDANRVGIIIGLKEGQFAKIRALELKKSFEEVGKKVQLIALTEICDERLQLFKRIDVFVQVACPRIAIDDHFRSLVLSVPQAHALIKLLKKEPIEDFLRIQHWL
jgi:2-(3-amino-3-carboxypropyl)histidine synthase